MLEHLTSFNPMNRMSAERRAAVIRCLAEGNSIRATVRMTGAAKATVTKLLVDIGTSCLNFHDANVRNLHTVRVEADEIWAFVGAKAANAKKDSQGDIWTWTAIDADSKLMVTWLVGNRNGPAADEFMRDLASRVSNRIQLTTDGLPYYAAAVERAFGYNGVDYAQIKKEYGPAKAEKGRGRYSPEAVCVSVEKVRLLGSPTSDNISTSYVERQNLTMRMQIRRFTRLTNAFSKKAENHLHAVSLHFMVYNFCKAHGTCTKNNGGIHTSPAMAAGLTRHVWSVDELLAAVSK